VKLLKKSIILYLGLAKDLASAGQIYADFVGYDYLYERLSFYAQSSIRDAVNQMEEAGLIEKFWRGRSAYFKLTVVGREGLERIWPALFSQPKAWRKYFYVVLVKKTTAKKRRFIVSLLKNQGFKKIASGTYMNFYPINEENRLKLTEKALLDRIVMIKAVDFGWLKPHDIIFQAWGEKKKKKITKQVVNKAGNLLKRLKQEKSFSDQSKNELIRLNKMSLKAFRKWPVLPKQFDELKSSLNQVFTALKNVSSAWQAKKH